MAQFRLYEPDRIKRFRVGSNFGPLEEIAGNPCWVTRHLPAIYKCLFMDTTVGFAVAGITADVWQVEQPVQAFYALVCQWRMGDATRLFFRRG